MIKITVSLKRKLAGFSIQRGLPKYKSLPMKLFTSYFLVCFHPLFTFPLPLPIMKKKYLCRVLPFLLHNFSSYKLLWAFINSEPPLGR